MAARVVENEGVFAVVNETNDIIYDDFASSDCAKAVADMENGDDAPKDWFECRTRLAALGFTSKDWSIEHVVRASDKAKYKVDVVNTAEYQLESYLNRFAENGYRLAHIMPTPSGMNDPYKFTCIWELA